MASRTTVPPRQHQAPIQNTDDGLSGNKPFSASSSRFGRPYGGGNSQLTTHADEGYVRGGPSKLPDGGTSEGRGMSRASRWITKLVLGTHDSARPANPTSHRRDFEGSVYPPSGGTSNQTPSQPSFWHRRLRRPSQSQASTSGAGPTSLSPQEALDARLDKLTADSNARGEEIIAKYHAATDARKQEIRDAFSALDSSSPAPTTSSAFSVYTDTDSPVASAGTTAMINGQKVILPEGADIKLTVDDEDDGHTIIDVHGPGYAYRHTVKGSSQFTSRGNQPSHSDGNNGVEDHATW